MSRIYAPLSESEELIAAKMAMEGVSQQKIARKLKIAKQSVATFLIKYNLGKRRPWSPTSRVIRKQANGWQLHLIATFEHFDTGEVKGNVACYSNFHAVKNHSLAYNECIAHGQGQCIVPWGSATQADENWIPIYVYKEVWIRWKPKD